MSVPIRFRNRIPCHDDSEPFPADRTAALHFLRLKSDLLASLMLLRQADDIRKRAQALASKQHMRAADALYQVEETPSSLSEGGLRFFADTGSGN